MGSRLALYGTQAYNAAKLKYVGGLFMIHRSENLTMRVLESIGGDFLFGGYTSEVRAPQLRSIGGNFLAIKVTELDIYRLRYVGGDMDTSSADQYYHPDVKLGGVWTIAPDAMANWVRRTQALELLQNQETPYLPW